MVLLSGNGLEAVKYVPAVEMSLDLRERDSTATMVPDSIDGIEIKSWIQDDTEPGNGIVWRVRSITQAYDTQTPQVQLEHAVNTLKDRVMFGEYKPADITGNESATTCTAKQAVQYILSFQSDWTLGDFDYNSVTNPYRFDGDTLFEALEIVSESLTDAWWSYDFSVYPFRLNITQKNEDVTSEMRAGRNLRTIRKTIDKSGMYTRFYPVGKDDLHIDGQYVERNTGSYGVISKVETDQSIDSKAELTRWANERLKKHAEPTVTIDVEGLELADATGESLDSFELGRVCRIPLPEFGTTITERIVAISYRDKIRQPEVVRIQLANTRNDVTKILAEQIRKGGRGGRGAARQQKEDHAWFEDTNTHVAMVAEGIVGVDAQGNPNWTRLSQIIADENGLDLTVQSIQGDVTTAMSEISLTEDRIMAHVSDVAEGLESDITVAAGSIMSTVQSTLDGFYTQIIQEAEHLVIRTGESTKTYHQPSEPQGSQSTPLVEGDLWFKAVGEFTWGGASGKSWLEDGQYTWGEKKAGEIYRYDGQAWKKVVDEKGILEDTMFEQSRSRLRMVAGRVDMVDGKIHDYRSEFQVTADQIKSEVKDYADQQQSMITQTAREIRMEVSDGLNGLSSSLSVTAREIRAEVSDSVNELNASLSVTAEEILGVVTDNKNDIESKLSVKANEIYGVVSDNKNDIEGKLSIQANRISLVVTDGANPSIKPASIVTAINGGSSSVVISADHINLDGYVKATDITADFLSARIVTLTGVTLNGVTVNSSAAFNGSLLVAVGSGYASVKDGICAVQITGPTNNQYKLQYKQFGDSSWTDAGTFSRATTLTGAWSSGIYTVTASPQGTTNSSGALTSAVGQAYRDGNQLYVPIYAGTTSTGYSAFVNWKDLLTSHSNSAYGLSRYNTSSKVELYAKVGNDYYSQGNYYWYYRQNDMSLTTLYN